jgi:16S rRNA (guanine966-N2)-methyltransferase
LGTVRIISGSKRGRKLEFPDEQGLRPTTDRTRETLFNWLQPVIAGADCLDLFAGSGILSFESLSRAAHHVTLIEQHHKTYQYLQTTVKKLQFENITIHKKNTLSWLEQVAETPFDVIFLDPPFHQGLLKDCCGLLEKNQYLHHNSKIYIESEQQQLLDIPDSWLQLRAKKAGQVNYYLYEKVS